VHLSSRTAERSSGLSDSDDPSGRRDPKERVTKAGARLVQICTICLATRAANVNFAYLLTFTEASREAPPPPPPRTSHAHLLDRLYDEKATATEARLRTQARLRARLAAERRLAQGDGDASAASLC